MTKELTIRAESAEAALQKNIAIEDEPVEKEGEPDLAEKKESEELQIEQQ